MDNLELFLQGKADTTITYTQTPNPAMNIPYELTVKGFKKFYLNRNEQPDLTTEEQLILLCASGNDIYSTPSNTVAGIFKAREIKKRSKSTDEAIQKCSEALIGLNRAEFNIRSSITEKVSQKRVHANLLEYYLGVEKAMAEYEQLQSSILAPVINLKNRILETITRKPHLGPPYSQDEVERGRREWEQFRLEQGACPKEPAENVLKRYRYDSDFVRGSAFGYLYDTPELSSISEEYATSTIALQILDGSAFKKAAKEFSKNPSHYIRQEKEREKTHEEK